MKWLGGIVVCCALMWSAAASAQVAYSPYMARAEWTLKVNKHILARINRSKGLLREGLRAAGPMGRTGGVVYVRIEIDRAGRILSTDIARSSGVPELDAVVERLALRSGPLPALPPAYKLPTIKVVLPVRFAGRNVS